MNVVIVKHIKDQALCRAILLAAGALESFDNSPAPDSGYNGRGGIFEHNKRTVYAKHTPDKGYELFVFPEGTSGELVQEFVANDLETVQRVSAPREVPYTDHSLN
jgi:hypothetical protein